MVLLLLVTLLPKRVKFRWAEEVIPKIPNAFILFQIIINLKAANNKKDMTKLFALLVLHKNNDSVQTLRSAYDVSSFSFLQRSSIKEFIDFTATTLAGKTLPGNCNPTN